MIRVPQVLDRAAQSTVAAVRSTRSAVPAARTHHPQFRTRVVAVREVCPAFRRVTLHAAGPVGLDTFTPTGPDEYVGLFLPQPGRALHMPDAGPNPRAAVAALPADSRPDLRWYTIRAHRPEVAEVDVDVVCADHGGPGARWIHDVRAGDEVGMWAGVALHVDAPGHHLLLADETGLPGMLAVLDARGADPDRTFTAVLEVPNTDYLPPEVAATDVHVVLRGDRAPGSALAPAVADLATTGRVASDLGASQPGASQSGAGNPTTSVLDPVDHAWICAEGGTVAACRRVVLRQLHVPRRHVTSSGFWSLGRPRP